MEDNKEYLELLRKIEESNRQQVRGVRIQCIFSVITALFCVVIFIMICTFMPQLNAVLGNLEKITEQLSTIDLEGMVSDMDSLVVTGQQSLERTMEKLDLIDFETLNKAIENLAAVVEPLANFFNIFP